MILPQLSPTILDTVQNLFLVVLLFPVLGMPILLFPAADAPPRWFAIYDREFDFSRGSFAGESHVP